MVHSRVAVPFSSLFLLQILLHLLEPTYACTFYFVSSASPFFSFFFFFYHSVPLFPLTTCLLFIRFFPLFFAFLSFFSFLSSSLFFLLFSPSFAPRVSGQTFFLRPLIRTHWMHSSLHESFCSTSPFPSLLSHPFCYRGTVISRAGNTHGRERRLLPKLNEELRDLVIFLRSSSSSEIDVPRISSHRHSV